MSEGTQANVIGTMQTRAELYFHAGVSLYCYVIGTMQTRAELYEHLNYHNFEQKLDALFSK